MKPLEVTEEQALAFRRRRGQLTGPGAPTAAAAAAAMIGAQSQQLPPSLHALGQRTKTAPTAAGIKRRLHGATRSLVRTWGQRDTLFLYDPRDWPWLVAARAQWQPGGRGGPMPTEAMLDKALAVMHDAGRPVSRTDLLGVAPRRFVNAIAERARAANMDPERLAAARLLWKLAHRGDVCLADKVGAEQTYATRAAWFPDLRWEPPPPEEACRDLARRYLAGYGPATPQDLAHFFHAKVTSVRGWLASIDGELIEVRCGDRRGLVALAADADELRRKPPSASATRAWPVRLLPRWESLLMAHADKSWTVPDQRERKLVWRKAAMVAPVVLARGRIVATWTQTARRGRLQVRVQPLSGWRKTKHAAGVTRAAAGLADHLELSGADVAVEP